MSDILHPTEDFQKTICKDSLALDEESPGLQPLREMAEQGEPPQAALCDRAKITTA